MPNILLLMSERKVTGPMVPLRQAFETAIVEGLGQGGHVRVYEVFADGAQRILAIGHDSGKVPVRPLPSSSHAFAQIVENPNGKLVTVSLE